VNNPITNYSLFSAAICVASKEGIDIELSESDEEENGVPLEHGDTEDSSSSSDEDEDDGFSHFLNS